MIANLWQQMPYLITSAGTRDPANLIDEPARPRGGDWNGASKGSFTVRDFVPAR